MRPFRTAGAILGMLGALVSPAAAAEGITGRVMVKDRPAYDATVASYRQTVLTAFQDVEDNLSALSLLAQEQSVQDEAVTAARQAAAIANNQYKAGITSYLAVIVLQASALNSERTALTIRGRRFTASVALIKALGGGFDATTLASAAP